MRASVGAIQMCLCIWLLAACASLSPVMDLEGVPVVTASEVVPTAAMVRDAIVRGAARRGWTIVAEDATSIGARVEAGGHWAVVLIEYTDRAYSISRVESSLGLKYDGKLIHRRYNQWIVRLRSAITGELASTTAVPAAALPAPSPPPPEIVPAPGVDAEELPPAPPPP